LAEAADFVPAAVGAIAAIGAFGAIAPVAVKVARLPSRRAVTGSDDGPPRW
jgi:hypothetical protein